MSRILVLGGYGGFGARIAKRLASMGHQVIVAGRSGKKASAFCGDNPGLVPLALDRREVARALAEQKPDLVVDASGPFQAMDYVVPAACIAARVAYCDIADGRDFVCGIDRLNAQAEAAGVAVITGASSVPALSGAAVRELAQGAERVRSVEVAISATNRATAGVAVAASILSQIGSPFEIWRGGRWMVVHGWQKLRCLTFALPGGPTLHKRLVGFADVPDLSILPRRLPGAPAVVFRAGAELAIQNLGLWLLSWPVRWRWFADLTPIAGWLRPLQRLSGQGNGHSAMMVRLFGDVAGRQVERRWTLIASQGDGPEIPALAAPLIAERILAGREKPGVRDAGLSLTLADYEQVFSGLHIRTAIEELPAPPCLYRRVMEAQFEALPDAVRALHTVWRDAGVQGEAVVTGSQNWAGRLIARIVGFPPPGHHRLNVSFRERNGRETWTRDFGGHCFESHLTQAGSHIVERFGPLRFRFKLALNEAGLAMHMKGWSFLGIPLLLAFAPRSLAREWEESGRFWFDVPISLPLIGQVVRYRGWLDVSTLPRT